MKFPKGFRHRRGVNWGTIGLLYASYYLCRYNLRFAIPGIQQEYGYDLHDVSLIFALWSFAYGVGQFINGLLTDVIGGKKSILIGAVGTLLVNIMFGFSSGVSQFFSWAFLAVFNGYFQSFGAPGMIKLNAPWFRKNERGTFAGIFGGMIQLGQVSISHLAPLLLNAGLVIGTTVLVSRGEWRVVFMLPPFITLFAAIMCFFIVYETPESAGFPNAIQDINDNSSQVKPSMSETFKVIFHHPFVWFYALAYACTGGVRHSLDQLSILYFRDQLGFDMQSNIPWIASLTLMAMPAFAFLGSLISGVLSDKVYHGERGELAVILYYLEALIIGVCSFLLYAKIVEPNVAGVFVGCLILVLIALTVNSTHSLIGAAAPMDIGGPRMAGFAAGLIDSFQYFGGALSFLITGYVLQLTQASYGYLFWYLIMTTFGLIGGTTMLLMVRKKKKLECV